MLFRFFCVMRLELKLKIVITEILIQSELKYNKKTFNLGR